MPAPPFRSTYQSGYAGSLWWKVRQGATTTYCASQGKSIIKAAQTYIQQSLGTSWRGVNDIIGDTYGLGFHVDGIPGYNTLQGVYAIARDTGQAPQDVLDQIAADIFIGGGQSGQPYNFRGRQLSWATGQAILFAAQGAPQGLTWAQVVLPPDALAPNWDVAPPDDSRSGNAGSVQCWDANAAAVPDALTTAQGMSDAAGLTPGPAASSTDPYSAADASPGNAPVGYQSTETSSVTTSTSSMDLGPASSWGPVAIGAGVAVVGASLVIIARKRRAARRR